MSKVRFTEDQFKESKFITPAKKARIANAIVRFIESGFDEKKFTNEVYTGGLMYMFGDIAHYNRGGFYNTWFSRNSDILEWLKFVTNARIYGEPEYTLCDVERVIRDYVIDQSLVEKYSIIVEKQNELRERNELARLKAKYENA